MISKFRIFFLLMQSPLAPFLVMEENRKKSEAKAIGKEYEAKGFENGDTRKQLLARSRYLLFKSAEK